MGISNGNLTQGKDRLRRQGIDEPLTMMQVMKDSVVSVKTKLCV